MPESKPFAVGDVVWFANCGSRQVERLCPVCYGKRKVVLILGNDDRAELPCDCCGHGWREPSGFITEYEWLAEPEQVCIARIDRQETSEGEQVELYGHGHTLTHNAFWTKEEATARCSEVIAEREKEQTTRAESIKKNPSKSYSWNAGYHILQAKGLREKAEYHDKMAVICKSKAKGDVT